MERLRYLKITFVCLITYLSKKSWIIFTKLKDSLKSFLMYLRAKFVVLLEYLLALITNGRNKL